MLHSFVQNLRKIVIGTRNLDACGEAWERAGKKMKICEKTREGIVQDIHQKVFVILHNVISRENMDIYCTHFAQ